MHLSPTVRQLTALLLLLTLSAFIEAEGREIPRGIESKVLDKVPSVSERLEGYENPDVVIDRLSAIPLHSIEGVWRFAAEGTLMAIERTEDRGLHPEEAGTMTYRMIVVRAADLSLRPGTVMGYLAPTAKRGVYDARIYTGRTDAGTQLHSPKKFTLTLGDTDSRLAISSYGNSLRFNWWRLLPYMYRYVFSRKEKSPGDIEGCLRIYPAPAIPAEPRYL